MRRRWEKIHFNTLPNSRKDTHWDHHVIPCVALEIPDLSSVSPLSLKMTLIKKDHLSDPWHLLHPEDRVS